MAKKTDKRDALKRAAIDYHMNGRRGKIEVISSKPCVTQRDLSLAYTPGVAVPCLEIADDPAAARLYTAKGNLVAVFSNAGRVSCLMSATARSMPVCSSFCIRPIAIVPSLWRSPPAHRGG